MLGAIAILCSQIALQTLSQNVCKTADLPRVCKGQCASKLAVKAPGVLNCAYMQSQEILLPHPLPSGYGIKLYKSVTFVIQTLHLALKACWQKDALCTVGDKSGPNDNLRGR